MEKTLAIRVIILGAAFSLLSWSYGQDAGLVGHWTFDDPANLGKDSVSTNNGVVVGGAYAFAFATARVGAGALALDGTGGHLEVADNPALRFTIDQSYTVGAWVYVTTLSGGWEGVVNKSRNADPWYGFWIDPSHEWVAGGGATMIGTGVALDDNGLPIQEWHQVAVVQDGAAGTRNLYVDGSLAATGASYDANGTGPLWIGGAASVSEFFAGLIDDVMRGRRP